MLNTNYILTSDGNIIREDELYHYGVKGMKWGVRRFQNSDGSLTAAGRKRLEKKDQKWAKKKTEKITAKAKKASQRELDAYGKELLKLPGARNSDGRLSAQTVNAYNRKMAELMSQKTSDLRAPSGRIAYKKDHANKINI